MDFLIDAYKNTRGLHHAYVLEGRKETLFEKILAFLESEVDFNTRGNPDFWHTSYDSFGIEEGRALKDLQQKKAFTEDGRKIFVISFNFITREAQNSLLKVLEEPTQGTHFFIVVPSAEIFLPTVLSRVTLISDSSREDQIAGNEVLVKKFLQASVAERLSMLGNIIEEKNKTQAIEFLNTLESIVHERWKKQPTVKDKEMLANIIHVKKFLGDRAPSVKMILEHIALIA